MTWIRTIAYDDATGRLKQLYDRIKGPGNNVDNIMMAHSLRPHTMEGHMALYKYTLHHFANQVPEWFLEALGVLVSRINGCGYCVDHHFAGLRRLLKEDARAAAVRAALETEDFAAAFDAREEAALRYAAKLSKACVRCRGRCRGHACGRLRRRRDTGDQPGRRLLRLREPDRSGAGRHDPGRCPGPLATRLG